MPGDATGQVEQSHAWKGLFPDRIRGPEAHLALCGTWPGVGAQVHSCCVLRLAENSDKGAGAADSDLAYPPLRPLLPSGLTALSCFSLGRMWSRSPGASPWAAMWASTASQTSWSASRSHRASASTSSVWVSVEAWPGDSGTQRADEGLLRNAVLRPRPPAQLRGPPRQ